MAWNGSGGNNNDEDRRTATRSAASHAHAARRGLVVRGAFAALLVVLGAGVAWWLVSARGRQAPNKPGVKEATPDAAKVVKTEKPAVLPAPAKEPEQIEDPATKVVAVLSCVTNSDGQVIEKFRTADGKTHKVLRNSRPPLFKHVTDDLLSMVLVEHGSIPPLPIAGNMDREFVESLKDPIVISEDDDEAAANKKRAVAKLREEVDELMKQGIGFSEILREHVRIFNSNEALRSEAIAELRRVRDEGDTEGTKMYLDKVNDYLESQGVAPISMPTTMAERKAYRLQKQQEE